MHVLVITIFFASLAGLIGLFALKQWELSRGRVLFPVYRMKADAQALHLKELLEAGRKDLTKLPPLFVHAVQRIVHGMAVDAGHIAHWLGTQAHRLADAVSHKRNFTPRETKSEFLKKVSEHKNGNGNGEDGSPLV
ncbi:MAG TPA: hypothetical protein VMU25_04740 [Candidatus Paceibacterota bacterium]|nr:hypothetical protein [Candidatus Paceibacterota bacterium]